MWCILGFRRLGQGALKYVLGGLLGGAVGHVTRYQANTRLPSAFLARFPPLRTLLTPNHVLNVSLHHFLQRKIFTTYSLS